MSRFHPLTVASVEADARDCVRIALALPPPLQPTFAWRAGQHVSVRATIDGHDVTRSYSVCVAPGGDVLQLAVKRCPGGVFSTWANERLRAGDTLQVMPPAGHFGELPGERGARGDGEAAAGVDPAPRRYLGIAAGSGITPIHAIAQARLRDEPQSSVTLVCGNRASSTVVLRESLAALKDRYPQRVTLVHVLSREPQDIELFNGRLTRAKFDELFARWVDVGSHDAAFVCGPDGVMAAAREALHAAGMPASQVRTELFAASLPPRAAHVPQPRGTEGDAACEVTLVIDGTRRAFTMEQDRETVLDAGLRQGIDIRHACKGGVCATCRCKLLDGRVTMDAQHALEDYEIARGFVLACQAYPVTPRVVLDFDTDH